MFTYYNVMSSIKKATLIKGITVFPLVILLFACNSGNKKDQEGNAGTDSTQATTNLPKDAFAFRNITSSSLVNAFYFDYTHDRLYADPTKTISFTKMDSLQKAALLTPVLKDIDSAYIVKYMNAYFIAKQDKIGDYTPAIFWVSGDDYGALVYIVLNKELKPVSHTILYGGLESGPLAETDTSVTLPPYKQSFIKGNEIASYILHVQDHGKNKPATIDSVTYKTVVDASGHLNTVQLDSTRYKRMFKGFK